MKPTRADRRDSPSSVLYARVSSQEQAKEGFSIPAQDKLLRNYARERHLDIGAAFTDIETAKRAGRTGFDAMVTYLRKNSSCRVLLVEKTDRLYRNFRDWVTIDEIRGLEVHFVKEGTVISDESRSSEKFIHGIKVLMAKNFIDNLSEETRKGMVEKASQGIWPSYAPIGYLNADGANGKRTIKPDPALAPLVRRLYELCATGQHSVKELAAIAQNERLTRGCPINKSTVNKILRNRVYSGEFEWRGEKYTAAYESIVPRDVWLAAQAALDRRLGTRAKKTGHCFPFSGMLTCGSCGFAMVGEIKKGKYVYYHCSGARGKCGEPYVRQETLEEAYAAMLRRISIDEDIVNWIATALRESHGDQKRFRDESVAKLQQEHTRLQNRLDVMYEDRLDGRIALSLFERKSGEYRQEEARIQAEINGFGTADSQYMDAGIRLLELTRNMHTLFEKEQAAEKRRLLDFVVSNSVWREGKIVPVWRQPFDMIALANESVQAEPVGEPPENGLNQNWLPKIPEGSDVPLPAEFRRISKVLEPYRDDILMFGGMTCNGARSLGDGPGDHGRAGANYLTAVHPKKTSGKDISAGISVDQIVANRIGNETPFASLELGCEEGLQGGNCDSGYSCAYSNSISWRTPSSPLAPEVRPRAVFERLFGNEDFDPDPLKRAQKAEMRGSILDLVMGSAASLKTTVGAADQRKLDGYLFTVRDIEKRIQKAEQAGNENDV